MYIQIFGEDLDASALRAAAQNTKHQTPSPIVISRTGWCLVFDVYLMFEVWCLVFIPRRYGPRGVTVSVAGRLTAPLNTLLTVAV